MYECRLKIGDNFLLARLTGFVNLPRLWRYRFCCDIPNAEIFFCSLSLTYERVFMSILQIEPFAEVVQSFLTYLRNTGHFSTSTINCYGKDVQQFCIFLSTLKERQIDEVVTGDVVWYLRSMQRQRLCLSTIARKFAAIRNFFKFCQDCGLTKKDPTTGIHPPKQKKRSPKFMTQDEVTKLLCIPSVCDVWGLRDRAILQCLAHTGLRVGELVRLNLTDVDFKSAKIEVSGDWQRERFVPMIQCVADAIQRYLSEIDRPVSMDDDSVPLFINRSNCRLGARSINRNIKIYLTELGFNKHFSPQTLRASFAVKMLSDGAMLEDVQERLGNLSIDATRRYRSCVCC